MLKNDIGINAGIIWQLLSDKGMLSIISIVEITRFEMSSILLALGWLAREDKIVFIDNDILSVELNYPTTEIYY